jgi:hypothetical protein
VLLSASLFVLFYSLPAFGISVKINEYLFPKNYEIDFLTFFPYIYNTFLEDYLNIQMPEADDVFIMRSSNSELIVFGSVVDVKPIPINTGTYIDAREHNVQLAQALVKVKEILRGSLSAKQISVLFYNSSDIAFEHTPKLKVEDTGIYFLKKFQQGPATVNVHGYGPLKKGDFLPIDSPEQLQKIKKIIIPSF